jgi:hypothetical protein
MGLFCLAELKLPLTLQATNSEQYLNLFCSMLRWTSRKSFVVKSQLDLLGSHIKQKQCFPWLPNKSRYSYLDFDVMFSYFFNSLSELSTMLCRTHCTGQLTTMVTQRSPAVRAGTGGSDARKYFNVWLACDGPSCVSSISARRPLRHCGPILLMLLIVCSAGRSSLAQSPVSIFGNAVPQSGVDPDTGPVTLGVKFWSTQAGTTSGIRFYRAAENKDGYTVKLFTAGGSLLASAETSKDTCAVPCWQQVNFASPISLAANTTYIAAYYTSNGRYAGDNYGLTAGKTNGPLTAPASSAVGGNGVYTYSTNFPNQTWRATNYYVDVSFTPTTPTPYMTLSFNPPNPSISATAPTGTVVTTITAKWSNGSPFTGTLGFASPYSNDNGTFAISGNDLIIDPAGPGISADGGTVRNVTITAIQ